LTAEGRPLDRVVLATLKAVKDNGMKAGMYYLGLSDKIHAVYQNGSIATILKGLFGNIKITSYILSRRNQTNMPVGEAKR
jgi:hypothetical protein